MLNYLLKRLWYGFLVMIGIVVLIFCLFNILPGDPARMMLGQRADMASVEAINKDLGRDQPLIMQFANYANDLSPLSFHNYQNPDSYWYLDTLKYTSFLPVLKIGSTEVILKAPYLRRSYQSKREVSEVIREAFVPTAILAVSAMLFALVVGIALGALSAVYKDSWLDKSCLSISIFFMSLPSFFAAILAAWIFAFLLADYTGLNMVGSLYTVDDFGNGEYLSLKNLILPALTLGVRPLAMIIQLSRNSFLEEFGKDYIRTARAKGLSGNEVMWNHAFRNAMNPVVTAASGWFASLLAGAVFIEYVFDWKGLGIVIVDALEKYDFPVVMGVILFISVLLIIINLLTDVIYALLDPRIKLQ